MRLTETLYFIICACICCKNGRNHIRFKYDYVRLYICDFVTQYSDRPAAYVNMRTRTRSENNAVELGNLFGQHVTARLLIIYRTVLLLLLFYRSVMAREKLLPERDRARRCSARP